MLNYDKTVMYYQYFYVWTLAKGGTFSDSSKGKAIKKFVQKNVVVRCSGTKKQWWFGQTSSEITHKKAYYTVANSTHQYLACGA